ncbi:hypothetical protein ColTof4_14405 [Colletotrichum tofieldiae]|nr:hypothetical protein ColTof3_14875 [Colletotrichum tofieldiae]GKT81982.1 hypothetical protein ColTof4_14405 [Colletotrichum tofieldiae]
MKFCAKTWIASQTVRIQACPTWTDDFSDGVIVPFIMMTLIDGRAVPRHPDIAHCQSEITEQYERSVCVASKLEKDLAVDPALLQQTPLKGMKRRRSRTTDTDEIPQSHPLDALGHVGDQPMMPLPYQEMSVARASDWMLLLTTHNGARYKTGLDKYETQTVDAIRALLRQLTRVDEVGRELASLKEVERSAIAANKESERQTSAYKHQIASLLSVLSVLSGFF